MLSAYVHVENVDELDEPVLYKRAAAVYEDRIRRPFKDHSIVT